MNILFFVYNYYESNNNSGLQKDLIEKFKEKGHNIFIISNHPNKTFIDIKENINILYLSFGKDYEVKNRIKKAIFVLIKPYLIKKYFIKYFKGEKIDLVVGYAPYNVNISLVKYLKKKYQSKLLLMIWDFFPDNALNLGLIKKGIVYNFFKRREMKIYKTYDILVCNSEGGVDYLNKNYNLNKKICLIRNCEFIGNYNLNNQNKKNIRKKYGYTEDDILFIYGGNIGICQNIFNLLTLYKKIDKKVKILIVGYGTDKEELKKRIIKENLKNIQILDSLEKCSYEELLEASDIGLISLNEKFKVPNAPTKMSGYLKYGVPLCALLDDYTKNDLGKLIDNNDIGVWISANRIKEEAYKINNFIKTEKYKKIKTNCKTFYEKEFDIEKAYRKVIEEIKNN